MALLSSSGTLSRDLKRNLKYGLIQVLPPQVRLTTVPRILPDRKCIYIHVPKTGGTSIANVFSDLAQPSQKARSLRLHEHIKAREIKHLIGEKAWSQHFSFAFVRNPWDLMVSSYHWWLQKADPAHYKGDIEAIRALGSFTEFMHSRYGQALINECEGNLFDWIADGDELIVDFVGKFETFQADFNQVCDRIGLDPIELPHTNKTARRNYREYYDHTTQAMVSERFRQTIERFGYSF